MANVLYQLTLNAYVNVKQTIPACTMMLSSLRKIVICVHI